MTGLGLDEQAAALEGFNRSSCSVCEFLKDQPEETLPEWRALLDGKRRHSAVWMVMRKYGFGAKTADPVSNHRKQRHGAA